jgi:hypothetical protein
MAAGTPLTDADRAGWLAEIGRRLAQAHAADLGLVVSCSALKRSYRDGLRAACPGLLFVHLQGPADLLRQRLLTRTGHYMPPSLLDSQLATLEPPATLQDEGAAEWRQCWQWPIPIGVPAVKRIQFTLKFDRRVFNRLQLITNAPGFTVWTVPNPLDPQQTLVIPIQNRFSVRVSFLGPRYVQLRGAASQGAT